MSCEGDVLCADRSSIFLSRHCGSLAVIIVFVHFGHAVAGLRVVCTVRSLATRTVRAELAHVAPAKLGYVQDVLPPLTTLSGYLQQPGA